MELKPSENRKLYGMRYFFNEIFKLHNEKNQLNIKLVKSLKDNNLIDAICTKEKFFSIWK